jgi:microcystin-dependent protein
MRPLIIFLLTIASINILQGQVGFNNPSPDPKSILDLTATDKGLLVPRMTTALRDAISSSAGTPESLLVYDTNLKGFYFFQGGIWYSFSGWVKAIGSNNVSLTGNATVSGNISSGSITNSGAISTGSISVTGFANNALVPTGAIIMWSGATVPSGWGLCDGSAGRPDLRDRFIVGAGSSYGVGATGGQNTVTLSVNQLPPHSHGVNDPGHSHPTTYILTSATGDGGKRLLSSNFNNYGSAALNSDDATTGISIQNTGSGQAIDVRPTYYSLAYIIKL